MKRKNHVTRRILQFVFGIILSIIYVDIGLVLFFSIPNIHGAVFGGGFITLGLFLLYNWIYVYIVLRQGRGES